MGRRVGRREPVRASRNRRRGYRCARPERARRGAAETVRGDREVRSVERDPRDHGAGSLRALRDGLAGIHILGARRRRAAGAGPGAIGDAARDLHAARRQQPEHGPAHRLRSGRREHARGLPAPAGSHHRRAVLEGARRRDRTYRRSPDRHRRHQEHQARRAAPPSWTLSRTPRGSSPAWKAAMRSCSSPTGTTSTARGRSTMSWRQYRRAVRPSTSSASAAWRESPSGASGC